jgi:amidophosphoribosyltransferase
MKKAIGSLNPAITGFDASCFDGVYVTGDITAADIARMSASRIESGDGEDDGDDAPVSGKSKAVAR